MRFMGAMATAGANRARVSSERPVIGVLLSAFLSALLIEQMGEFTYATRPGHTQFTRIESREYCAQVA